MNTPVQEIKEKLNIVDIVGEYVRLKKMGANHKGLCPFHSESTPSFTVSEQKQFFHCFGCGKGGDIFQFIQETEHVEFSEALRMLAQRAGVTLTKQNPKQQEERARLLDCIEEAAKFYHEQLTSSQNAEMARVYAASRKLSDDTIRTFRIGYAPDSWSALIDHLTKKGYTPKEIELAGLSVLSQKGKYFDRFRGRLMFPIENAQGMVVGFTGRILTAEKKEAKYVNTPSTPLYNKSAVLYGLSHAKPFIQKVNAVVLMEGQMDVVSCFQAKIRNVVASSGTALTQEQVQLLSRYSKNILLAFDGDSAGISAAWKGMQLAIQQEMNIKVLDLPKGKDPADLATENPDELRELAKKAKPFMEYAFAHVLRGKDLMHVHEKKQAATELIPMISLFPDVIERTHYTQQLASLLSVDPAVLLEKVESLHVQQVTRQAGQNQPMSAKSRPQTGTQQPGYQEQQSPFPPQYQQEQDSGQQYQQKPKRKWLSKEEWLKTRNNNNSSQEHLAPQHLEHFTSQSTEETIDQQQMDRALAILLKYPEMRKRALEFFPEGFPAANSPTEEQQTLYKSFISQYSSDSPTTSDSSQINHISSPYEAMLSMLAEDQYARLKADEQEKELRMLLVSLKRSAIKRSIRVLQQRLNQAEQLGEGNTEIEEYIRQLSSLTAQLNQLG